MKVADRLFDISPLGNCTRCGRDAAWNCPTAPANNINGSLFCDPCSDDSPILRRGVEQRLYDGQRRWTTHYRTYVKGTVVIHTEGDNETIGVAWVDNGRIAVPREVMDEIFNPNFTLNERIEILDAIWAHGVCFCTICHEPKMRSDLKFYPFAGVACPSCWRIHGRELSRSVTAGED